MNIDQLAVEAARDRQAFGQLYDLLFARVYNYIRYRCDDLASAEDLTAQTFERMMAVLGTYDPGRGPFEPYLFAIARNLVNSFHRRQALRAWLPWEAFQRQPDPGLQPEEAALLRESESSLLAALKELKLQQRDLLGLKYGLGLGNQQIAAMTGLNERNVAVILHRGIEALRQKLAIPQPPEMTPFSQKEPEHAHK
jgi:RNA polymerase sigma factor (sigma-70 family)